MKGIPRFVAGPAVAALALWSLTGGRDSATRPAFDGEASWRALRVSGTDTLVGLENPAEVALLLSQTAPERRQPADSLVSAMEAEQRRRAIRFLDGADLPASMHPDAAPADGMPVIVPSTEGLSTPVVPGESTSDMPVITPTAPGLASAARRSPALPDSAALGSAAPDSTSD